MNDDLNLYEQSCTHPSLLAVRALHEFMVCLPRASHASSAAYALGAMAPPELFATSVGQRVDKVLSILGVMHKS